MTVHMEILQSDVWVILRDIIVVEGVLLQAGLRVFQRMGLTVHVKVPIGRITGIMPSSSCIISRLITITTACTKCLPTSLSTNSDLSS